MRFPSTHVLSLWYTSRSPPYSRMMGVVMVRPSLSCSLSPLGLPAATGTIDPNRSSYVALVGGRIRGACDDHGALRAFLRSLSVLLAARGGYPGPPVFPLITIPPCPSRSRKRPRDPSTSSQSSWSTSPPATPRTRPKTPARIRAAVALGRKGGLKGGKARASKLTASQRSDAAKRAAQARWSKG